MDAPSIATQLGEQVRERADLDSSVPLEIRTKGKLEDATISRGGEEKVMKRAVTSVVENNIGSVGRVEHGKVRHYQISQRRYGC
jgi:hypothetical protein